MRILVLGAGGTGGYFGGVAALAGTDVTFLVREARARVLEQRGLVIETPAQTLHLTPKLRTAGAPPEHFDVVVLSCKAYDLDSALDAIAPTVATDTVIVPLLNGLDHYAALDARFGRERVLGGFCQIGVTMTAEGAIRRMSPAASIVLGPRDASIDRARADSIAARLANADAQVRVSTDIARDAWEKFVFLGMLAAATCLLRGTIAEIQATRRGKSILTAIFSETCAVAAAQGFRQTPQFIDERRRMLLSDGATQSSSMYRDLLAGNRVESEHILGDLVGRAEATGVAAPYLTAAHCQLQAYEGRRR